MFNQINKNIVLTFGINALPIDEQKDEMRRIGEIIYEKVMLRVLDLLEEKDKDELEKLIMKNKNPEIFFDFLLKKIPNLEEIVKEETLNLKKENIEIMNEIGK